jgi:acyl-lipid omega-6 desaturase (Delta-12 desaturase)
MFGLGAAYQFFLRHRLPIGPIRGGWRAWISAMATNLAIAVAATALIWFIGIGPFLLVSCPSRSSQLSIWTTTEYEQGRSRSATTGLASPSAAMMHY